MENIFFNGYLMTPAEMNAFVDSFGSEHCRIHFDTGNIMQYQQPEHWIPELVDAVEAVGPMPGWDADMALRADDFAE